MDGDISMHQEEIDRHPVKNFFNIEGGDPEYNDDCDFIVGWAQNKGIKKNADLMIELKKLEYRLGIPTMGESRIKKMVSYLKSDAKLTDALKEVASKEQGWEDMA